MRSGFARLNNAAAIQTLAATSTAQVLWNRGGTAPEISQVTLDLSLNGGATWTPLGQGTRVGTTANWQLTGLPLPTSGKIRARGRTTGGYNNGSSRLVESVASFSGIAPATPPPSPGLRVVRITQEDGTLRMEFEAQPTAGLIEVWRAETVDADTWTRLDGSTLRPTTAGHLELRIPADPNLPQQFYRLEIHSEPVPPGPPR